MKKETQAETDMAGEIQAETGNQKDREIERLVERREDEELIAPRRH